MCHINKCVVVLALLLLLTNGNASSTPQTAEDSTIQDTYTVFQLVMPDITHNKLEINPEGIAILNSISQKVVVISTLGAFHTGKSFLMNQLMGEQAGFALGPTVAPETKGIWARISFSGDNAIIFLDTEGFFGQGASESYDAKIFAVATLLSSKLLFNSVKTIDQSSMDYLELLARRALMFSLKASVKEHHHSYLSFPSLTWVVHDFISDIPSEYGGSPLEWIKSLLSVRKRESVSLNDVDERMTNQELSNIFSSIDCHPLSFPLNAHPEKLRNLDTIPMDQLDPSFKAEIKALRDKIYSNLERKKFDDKELNGLGLAELLKTLVELANTGIFPKVPGVWEGFIRIESQTALGDCTEEFRKNLQSQINGSTPVPEARLQEIFEEEQTSALAVLSAMLLGLTEVQNKVASQLKAEVAKLKERFQTENQRNIESFCTKARESREAALDDKISHFDFPMSPSKLKERMLNISEQSQSEYKERVIAYATSPSCSPASALLKHIEMLQSTLETKNIIALRKACADAKAASLGHFGLHLTSIALPVAPSVIKAECAAGMAEAFRNFDEKLAPYKETDAYRETKKDLEQLLQSRKDNITLSNNNEIESRVLYHSNKIAVMQEEKYSKDPKLKTLSQMNDLLQTLTQEATDSFEKNTKYALESSSYSAWKLQFKNEMKGVTDKLVEANKKRIEDFFTAQSDAHLAALRQRYRRVAIPLEDVEVEHQIETHSNAVKREWEGKVKVYQSSAPDAYRDSLFGFNTEVQRLSAKLRKENVQELLQLCKLPIERSEQQIEQAYHNSWFQFWFEKEAYHILTNELRSTIKSEKLLHSAAQTYMEDTLSTKFPFSSTLSYIKAFAFVISLSVICIIGSSFFGKNQSEPRFVNIKKQN